MKFTEEKKFRPPWVVSCVQWILIGTLKSTWPQLVVKAIKKQQSAPPRLDERRNLYAMSETNAQEFKIRSIESQLKILKSGSKQSDSEVSHPAKQRDELASNAESGSGEDFRSSVLKSAKMRNRLAIANHFKQEDEFKESLSLSQKKKFDAEVKKVYENFLADSGVDREFVAGMARGCIPKERRINSHH